MSTYEFKMTNQYFTQENCHEKKEQLLLSLQTSRRQIRK